MLGGKWTNYSYLIDPQHRFLLAGIVTLVMAVVFTLMGGTFERRGSIVYRAKEPDRFWWNLASFNLLGLFFIGVYLHETSK